MTVFYTSDPHVFHKLVAGHRGYWQPATQEIHDQYSSPYALLSKVEIPDPERYAEMLADYWDSTVKHDDVVYILGDTGMGRWNEVLAWFDERPGVKHLIAGNHDPVHPARSDAVKLQPRWLQTFRTINPYTTRKIAGQKVMLSHFPYQSFGDGGEHGEPEGRWNEWRIDESLGKLLLHGHTHGKEKAHDGNQLHVGLDAWGRFVEHEEVEEWVKSVA
jgi:calcineurin-like phosphoesterase family protein